MSELFLHILPQIAVKVRHIVHGIACILDPEGFRDPHDITGLQFHPGPIHGQKIHLFGQCIGMIHIQRILEHQDQIRPVVIHGHEQQRIGASQGKLPVCLRVSQFQQHVKCLVEVSAEHMPLQSGGQHADVAGR